MSLNELNQTLQFLAWFLVLVEVIIGFYFLVLNAWHTANRHAAALFFLFALNNFSLGILLTAEDAAAALVPTFLMAATSAMIQPFLLINAVVLIKIQWLQNRRRAWIWVVYVFLFLPALLTFVDAARNTGFWYTGLDPRAYSGGFVEINDYTGGSLANLVRIYNLYLAPLGIVVFLVRILRDNNVPAPIRRLSWFLLTAEAAAMFVQFGLGARLYEAAAVLVTTSIFVLAYGSAGIRQLNTERRLQRGSLQGRLTALILIVSLPVLIFMVAYVTSWAGELMEKNALENLHTTNSSLSSRLTIWLDYNVRALQEMASQPDIVSMDAGQQKPVLEAMAGFYPQLYLVSTTDLNGKNISRSDVGDLQDYSDQTWFKTVIKGEPLAFQVQIGNAGSVSSLIAAVPIRNTSGEIRGVAMFASDLALLREEIQAVTLGRRGVAFIVDADNQVVLHPDPEYLHELHNLSQYPPVTQMRQGNTGLIRFTDEGGQKWRAYTDEIGNHWGVIVQQPEVELLASFQHFRRGSWLVMIAGALILFTLGSQTIRQSIQPIRGLTSTVLAISSGDLTHVVPVESQDEIGQLSQAFNSMTNKLRDLISDLEKRAGDRTRQLERRAVQLQVTAEIARSAASIRDDKELLNNLVHLISDRFGFYHAGIFLIDEAHSFAVLRAASSKGGQRMLARNHKLKVGQEGIVGYSAAKGEARIALDVGQDAVFFNNPDLPQTRSEMALPLKVGQQVVGILDVQSTKSSAFTQEDIEILQILADQVALAIENARLLKESSQALKELENLYGRQAAKAWHERMSSQNLAYAYHLTGVRAATDQDHLYSTAEGHILKVPILLREQTIGVLTLRRDKDQPAWNPSEVDLVKTILGQMALALENARLLEENRRRAENEYLIGQISATAQSSLDLDTVMKRSVKEIGLALGAARVQIRLGQDATREEELLP